MKTRKYCCDASKIDYENYYMDQVGSGLPIFVGSRGQRGHGLGSVLGGLFRSAVPMVKKGLASLGKNAIRTGLSIATDVLEGKNAGEAAKSRLAQGIKNLVDEHEPVSRKRPAPKQQPQRKKLRRNRGGQFRHKDIFD